MFSAYQHIACWPTLTSSSQACEIQLATLTYRCLHSTAPRYLSFDLSRVAYVPYRRHLRSGSSDALLILLTRLATVGDYAFSVAAAKLWNELLGDIIFAQSLTVVCRQLKTFLFRH
jgi:hypothetical protein